MYHRVVQVLYGMSAWDENLIGKDEEGCVNSDNDTCAYECVFRVVLIVQGEVKWVLDIEDEIRLSFLVEE